MASPTRCAANGSQPLRERAWVDIVAELNREEEGEGRRRARGQAGVTVRECLLKLQTTRRRRRRARLSSPLSEGHPVQSRRTRRRARAKGGVQISRDHRAKAPWFSSAQHICACEDITLRDSISLASRSMPGDKTSRRTAVAGGEGTTSSSAWRWSPSSDSGSESASQSARRGRLSSARPASALPFEGESWPRTSKTMGKSKSKRVVRSALPSY